MYSLPYFKKNIKFKLEKIKNYVNLGKNNNLVFQIRGKYNNTDCINCGLKTSKRKDKKLHKQKTLVKHMPFGGDKVIELELHKRHFKCENCETDFLGKIGFYV
ncbi:MAG: hypothetical protein Q9M97_00860 [Candidatus Gracilibacteria bacterium]|nr:hypothetical protein [Candidatus Gracilibacteria bacterium]